MLQDGKEVIYIKASKYHGVGTIPLGTKGIVLKYIESKVLVDFDGVGKTIVPISSISLVK